MSERLTAEQAEEKRLRTELSQLKRENSEQSRQNELLRREIKAEQDARAAAETKAAAIPALEDAVFAAEEQARDVRMDLELVEAQARDLAPKVAAAEAMAEGIAGLLDASAK